MLVTLVLRLLPDPLAEGQFVGAVERVGDGERVLVQDLAGLIAFAQRAATETTLARGEASEEPSTR